MGDPAFYNIYESLKAAYLYSHATGSPISSTLLNIMNQVDRLAVNTTLLLMDQLKHQLPKFPSISKQTHLPDSISSVAPSTASPIILDANSVRTSCAVDDIHITSLLSQVEELATFQELHLSSVDKQCRSILAACENDNLQLAIQLQQSQLDLQRLERANSAQEIGDVLKIPVLSSVAKSSIKENASRIIDRAATAAAGKVVYRYADAASKVEPVLSPDINISTVLLDIGNIVNDRYLRPPLCAFSASFPPATSRSRRAAVFAVKVPAKRITRPPTASVKKQTSASLLSRPIEHLKGQGGRSTTSRSTTLFGLKGGVRVIPDPLSRAL